MAMPSQLRSDVEIKTVSLMQQLLVFYFVSREVNECDPAEDEEDGQWGRGWP